MRDNQRGAEGTVQSMHALSIGVQELCIVHVDIL